MFVSVIFAGCNTVDKVKVKLGIKNDDFEYIKQGKVNRIIIQNTRDKGFTFIVEDRMAILDIYDILSSAKYADKKSTLKPDYIFEIYQNDEKVNTFNYVVGIDKKSGGNFYNDESTYIVSKRLDNDIIENFWNISKPKRFYNVYYGSIIKALEKYKKDFNISDKIGIDIYNDVEMNKFLLSIDLENFKSELDKENINADIIDDENNNYNVTASVTTEGYKSTLYKSKIKIWDKEKNSEKIYYLKCNYNDKNWDINIYEDNKPDDWY